MVKNQKIYVLLIKIAQKKGFDVLNATQKTSALCKMPLLKKLRNNSNNCRHFFLMEYFEKNCIFCILSRFFLNCTL